MLKWVKPLCLLCRPLQGSRTRDSTCCVRETRCLRATESVCPGPLSGALEGSETYSSLQLPTFDVRRSSPALPPSNPESSSPHWSNQTSRSPSFSMGSESSAESPPYPLILTTQYSERAKHAAGKMIRTPPSACIRCKLDCVVEKLTKYCPCQAGSPLQSP